MDTRRKLPRLTVVLACAAAVTLSACTSSDSDDGTYRFTSATAIGDVIAPKNRLPVPELEGSLLTGKGKLSVASQKNKVVVLAFWASWCGPCRVEMPQLDGLHDELASKGVSFIGVDSRDAAGSARAFLTQYKIGFPSISDRNGELPQKLGNVPAGLPFTIVIDKSGKVAATYVVRYGAKDLARALTTLRAES